MKRTYSTSYAAGPATMRSLPPKKRRYTDRKYYARKPDKSEWKYLDTPISATVSQTASLTLLNGMQNGNTATTRIGSKIDIKSLQMRMDMSSVLSNVTLGSEIRLVILQDKQTNGAAPPNLASIMTSADYLGMRNLDNRKRYKFLLDKTFVITPTGTEGQEQFYTKYLKWNRRPIQTEYNSTNAGTVADITTNSLYVLLVGDQVSASYTPGLNGLFRIRFTDV